MEKLAFREMIRKLPRLMNEQTISCTYVGHATMLINITGTNILTDPHFGKHTVFMPREAKLNFDPAKLPELAAILLSHTHYDHLNIGSYKYISSKVPIIVPEGSERAVGQYVSNPVIELSYFANHELTDGTIITAVPAKHRSGRISQLRYTKTNAYLIKKPNTGTVYFCGESAYGNHFKETGNLGPIELAILPIGHYEPQWLMRSRHMTPAEAVQAFEDLAARHMVPIHYGTFRLSLENLDAPLNWLEKILSDRGDLKERIHTLKSGESFTM